MKKINPEAFLKAAALIAQGEECWACNAIAEVARLSSYSPGWEYDRDNLSENRFFREMFYDASRAACNISSCSAGWWKDYDDEPRMIALCLAYHIAKDMNRQNARKRPFRSI